MRIDRRHGYVSSTIRCQTHTSGSIQERQPPCLIAESLRADLLLIDSVSAAWGHTIVGLAVRGTPAVLVQARQLGALRDPHSCSARVVGARAGLAYRF
jgi:hypothetical protein